MSVLFVHFSVLFAIEYTAKLEWSGIVCACNEREWSGGKLFHEVQTNGCTACHMAMSMCACAGAYVSIAYKVNYPRQTEKVKWMI